MCVCVRVSMFVSRGLLLSMGVTDEKREIVKERRQRERETEREREREREIGK